MPLDQRRESRVVMTADVFLEQLPISQPIAQQHHPAQPLDNPIQLPSRHVRSLLGFRRRLPYYYLELHGLIHDFCRRNVRAAVRNVRSDLDRAATNGVFPVIGDEDRPKNAAYANTTRSSPLNCLNALSVVTS